MAEQKREAVIAPFEPLLDIKCRLFLDSLKSRQREEAKKWMTGIIDVAFNRGSEVTYEAIEDWYQYHTRFTLNRQPVMDGIVEYLRIQGKHEEDLTPMEHADIRSTALLMNIEITAPPLPRLRQLMMDFGEGQPESDLVPSLNSGNQGRRSA